MNKTFESLKKMIGNTPLLEIKFLYKGKEKRIFAKAEYFNMTGSIKDRVALHILEKAYKDGTIKEGDIIAEATSGNTGISFCAVGTALGHKSIIFMPDWMSSERVNLIKSFGAEIVGVSREEGGFLGSIAMADALEEKGGYFLPHQFTNEENTNTHYNTTGLEIVNQLKSVGLVADACVAGVGTGGTVMGINRRLKEVNPNFKGYALEPKSSPTLSTGFKGGIHRIQGISDEFIPDILKIDELAGIVAADDGDSINMARMLSSKLGIGVGVSSGANFLGCIEILESLPDDAVIVTTFADDNKKYLSTDYSYEQPVKDDFISKDVELLEVNCIR